MMSNEKIIDKTIEYVKDIFKEDSSGHDWSHTYRVYKSAITIGKAEGVNLFVVELASLLHDIDDYKLTNKHIMGDTTKAHEWLCSLNMPQDIIDRVCGIISNMSYKGSNVKAVMKTKEGMVVQDADRLDAIGAIGIGRAFAYGGSHGREMHNPEIMPSSYKTAQEYMNNIGTTINHFYEKLLLLKDLMNTDAAKKMAEKRHQYMEEFLKTFLSEWDGME